MNFLYLALAICGEVFATSLLKRTEGFTLLLPTLIVIGGYVFSFYCLSLTLRTIPVGVAYAIWSGVGIVSLAFIGWVFYKQSLNLPTVFGIGLIVIGVIFVHIFSKSSPL